MTELNSFTVKCHIRCHYLTRKQSDLRAGERMLVLLGLLLLAIAPLAYYMATTVDAIHSHAFKTGFALTCIAVTAAIISYISVFHGMDRAACEMGEHTITIDTKNDNFAIHLDDGPLPAFKDFWMDICLFRDENCCLAGGKVSEELLAVFLEKGPSLPKPMRKTVTFELYSLCTGDVQALERALGQEEMIRLG